ncbi:helix-turn-helix transcriptional regulator [Calidifontibacter sp. DB0510]|uniref:Helix-turn-helix transcriptional regulator n=1 Tax=Metallococcus carri TaxID=1656884 RepID=A0A967B1X8_9MICO|nr:PadR family transcriptional regulator [Metallococcus carri]NHN57321.1 helix-turn-helix transcriptional regulator [Metallococcus carri]NOP38074.1 helix-turn-helix transcriptional regulator [Calidifontibacter sp. DB2511S]
MRDTILALLAEGPHNGYQIIAAIKDRTDGLWAPSAGSVYPALGLLEDEGLIAPTQVDGKKAFELTDTGREHVAERGEELKEPWTRVVSPNEGLSDARQQLGQLAMALHQVAAAGTPEQLTQVQQILDDARKAIYRVLAE